MLKINYLLASVSMLLTFALVLGTFVFLPSKAAISVTADSGYYDWGGYSTYLKGAGTDSNPFLISSPSDLAYFRKQVALSTGTITYYTGNDTSTTAKTKDADNSTYKLTCDIYYNDPNGDEWKSWSSTVTPTNGGSDHHTWLPPGYGDETNRRFEGHFDGDGHTIYGMYIVQTESNGVGFLGAARYSTIENLTLDKGYVEGANHVGGFIGQARVGVDIINCTNGMRIQGEKAVGGFIGGNAKEGTLIETDADLSAEGYIPSYVVYESVNNGTVDGTKYVGGISGYVSAGASRAQFEKCENNGAVTGVNSAVGGILGGTRQVDGYGHNVIQSCINRGAVKGSTGNATANAGSYYGGIVGVGRAIDIYSCINYGSVSSPGSNVGGISGGNNTSDALCNNQIRYCYNAGTVVGSNYTAGIAGVAKSTNINMCGNVGIVTGMNYVGGIAGRSCGSADKRDCELYNCYNTGKISSTSGGVAVAGIVGEAYCEGTVDDNKYAKVKRCINVGEVSTGRAISYSSSTLQDSEGTGKFVYTQFDDTCFGLAGVSTNFDGGTQVSSFNSDTVLAALNSGAEGVWAASYPIPVLTKIDYDVQNYSGRGELFGDAQISVTATPTLSAEVTVNTSGAYYGTISSFDLSYGVLAVKSEALGDGVLTADTESVIKCTGSISNGKYTAALSGQTVDEYDDLFTIRPYVSFTVNGQQVYAYGQAVESSYYTAEGAEAVEVVNTTAAFECEEKLYMLVGGSDTIDCGIDSASREDSISYISSNPSVATVSKGKVTGVSAGSATITVTYTGDWGAKTQYCQVTVLEDLETKVLANQYAEQDGKLRLRTNELFQMHNTISKNDGTVIDYNGTVILIDGGHNNSKSLEYLLELRDEYLADGLAAGTLTEADYYRHKLSKNCQVQIISFITHWHSDHIFALRYAISKSPYVTVKKLYTNVDPTGTGATGLSTYISGFDTMVNNLLAYSPDLVPTQFAFGTEKIRYFSGYNTISTSDSSLPLKVTMCTSKDWSTSSLINSNGTVWQNCSSMWYLIEFGGYKILYTGDTYNTDVGSTYSGNTTSGSTAVDYMLYLHKSIITDDIDFLDCNHHGRGSFVANLFTETKPSIVFSGLYYGQDDVNLVNKAVETANVYLGGDGAHVFVVDSNGTVNTEGASIAYNANSSGHAIRNHTTLHYNRELVEEAPATATVAATGITLSSSALTVVVNDTEWLAATVLGDNATDKNVVWSISDPTVLTTDGAYVKGLKAGTVTVTATSGGYTATCTVNVISAVGDANGDGTVSASDLLTLRDVVSGNEACTDDIRIRGDMDSDGQISATDVLILKTKLTDG